MIAATQTATAWWSVFWEWRFLDNALWQWMALLGVIVAAMVVGKIVSLILLHGAKRMDMIPEKFIVTSMFARSMAGPVSLFALALGLYGASFFMTFAPKPTSAILGVRGYWIKACETFAVLAVTWLLYRLVDIVEHLLHHITGRTETTLDDQLVPLIRKTIRLFLVIVAAVFIAQNIFECNVGAVLAGLGIGGLAFALAAKDMLANFFGSATIFADRPFQMAERVKVKGYDGVIEEVGFRTTRLRLLDGNLVTIPNAIVANEPVENVSRRPSIKRVLNVTITYDTPPEKVQTAVDILNEMLDARKGNFPANTPPRVYFSDFNAESLNIVVYYWFAPADWWAYLDFNHDFNMELLRRYNEEGIEFAFPTQTLYLKQDSQLKVDVQPSSAH